MYLINILCCMLVFSCSEISSAFTRRSCFDCISILSCESGKDFVRRLGQGDLPPQSRQKFLDAVCGTDSNNYNMPKVCCSDFAMHTENSTEDPIETHPNVGLLPTSCGNIKSGIFHGRIPKLDELPWMTLITYTTWKVNFRCAGSVINSRYILTAAHCVTNGTEFRNITGVRIGEYDYSTNTDCQGDYENLVCESRIQDIEVEEMIPHENFTGLVQPDSDNIALLRLKEAIDMADNAAPICLPVYSDLRNTRLAGKNAIIAGWGFNKYIESTKLMKALIPILSSENCSHYYNRNERQRISSMEKSFCAGGQLANSCFRTGGPLIMESDYNNQVRLVQYGINSFGPNNCESQIPDFYTDVTKYMGWILDHIRA